MAIRVIPYKPGVYTVGKTPITVWKWANTRLVPKEPLATGQVVKVLVKLMLLPGTRVVVPKPPTPHGHHPHSRKFRADQAYVLDIRQMKGKVPITTPVFSGYDNWFTYAVRTLVEPQRGLDIRIHRDCGSGIHAFRTPAIAKEGRYK